MQDEKALYLSYTNSIIKKYSVQVERISIRGYPGFIWFWKSNGDRNNILWPLQKSNITHFAEGTHKDACIERGAQVPSAGALPPLTSPIDTETISVTKLRRHLVMTAFIFTIHNSVLVLDANIKSNLGWKRVCCSEWMWTVFRLFHIRYEQKLEARYLVFLWSTSKVGFDWSYINNVQSTNTRAAALYTFRGAGGIPSVILCTTQMSVCIQDVPKWLPRMQKERPSGVPTR